MINKDKKDESVVLDFFNNKGIEVYTENSYRELLRSERRKDSDYAEKINKKLYSIFDKSEFNVGVSLPEHCIGFVYMIFTEDSILSKPIDLLDKKFWISPRYTGYAKDPKRPIDHIDKITDSIFDYTSAIRNNSNSNLYIAILVCGLTQQHAQDIEAIFQRIFRNIQLPGGRIGENYGILRNSRMEKPSSILSFDRIEDFRNFRHLF